MNNCSQRLIISSLAMVVLVSGYANIPEIARSPRTEKIEIHLTTSSVYWAANFVQTIINPRAAMAQSLVEARGKVIAVTPERQQIVLEHGEIKGFMDAMTMGYRVSSTSLLTGLQPGDEVHFSIDPKKSTIVDISKLEK